MKRKITVGIDSFPPTDFDHIAADFPNLAITFAGYVDYAGEKNNRFVISSYVDPFLNDIPYRYDLEKLITTLHREARGKGAPHTTFIINFLALPEQDVAPTSFDFEAWVLKVVSPDDIRGSMDSLATFIKAIHDPGNPLRPYSVQTLIKEVGKGWVKGE